jgi:hypothetical protein
MDAEDQIEESPTVKILKKIEDSQRRQKQVREIPPKYVPGKQSPFLDTQLFPDRDV